MFQLTKKTSLKSLPLCILITAFLFTAISCENFLSGGNLKSDVDNIIADVNAEKVSVLLSAEGQGEVNPSGNQVFKIGRENKKISYTEDKEHKYCFLYWAVKAGTGDNAKYLKKGVDYTIDDEYSPETKITILKYTKDMAVVPVCAERIAVEDYSPKMVKDGVSRDRSISINFSKEPSLLSFYFTLDEIPGECDYHEIEIGSEKYIAYYIDELENRVFKNITILDTDKNNLCEYFDPPVIEGKLLTINVSKQIPIDTTGSRTVEVTLGSSIYDNSKEKVTMNKEVNFQYKITEETDVKSYVTLKSPVDESKEDKPEMGTVAKTFDKKDFSIGASFDLSFTENADYQFIKWTYDPQYIYVENPEDISAKAMIRDAADRDTPTEVTALCAPRLAVKSFYPVTDVNTLTVCKDQTIKILFNNPLPLDESQLEKITITIGGLTVKTSFKAPVVEQTERKEITFEADKSKMISFQGERQKTVTVSIPADLYYLYDDTYEVTVGGSGKTFSYDIDDTTLDKAEVYFRIPEGSGTITPAANEMFNYSRGETVALEFKMNDDFIFNGWEIKAGNTDVSASDIEIADKKSLSTKLYVHEAITNVTVTANCSPKFKIEEITPAGTESNPSEKDSSIVIKFNKPLAAACDLSKIKVTQNGKAVDSSFNQRVLSGNTVTLTNTKLLNISSDDGVIPVTVTVPADFYYNDGINDISLGEKYVYDYYVNYKTLKQAKITFGIINGENNQSLTGVGTINQEAFSSFSIGETAQLEYNLDQNYQFVKWELKTSDGQSVPSTLLTLRDSLLTVKGEISNARINAVCCKRPSVTNKSPVNTYENPAYKDTAIVIDFGHVVDAGCKDAVVLSSADGNGTDFVTLNKNEYFSSSLNTERTKLTLTPIKMIPFENSNIKTIRVTVPKEKVFYTVNNNKIYMNSEDYYWDYVIQNSTSTQTNILYNLNNQNIVAKKINYSSSTTQPYNLEETIPLQLNVKDNYSFNGWRITTGLDTYTVQPEGFVKSGTVLVKSGDDVYFTFTIDADNPAKATAYINKIIGNGIDNYGVSIEASELLMPKAETVELPGIDTAVECDTQQEINFIKALDPYTVSLYSSASEPGSVQIVNANTNEHFERYFTVSCVNGYKRIILKPSIDIIEEFKDTGVSVITLKVILDPNVIIDADGLNIGGITEWIYKINSKTNAKTKIRFTLNNADVLINNEPYEAEKSYDIGEVLNIECIPDSVYKFDSWIISEGASSDYVSITDINSSTTTITIKKSMGSTAVVLKPKVVLIPKVESISVDNQNGQNCDTEVVITFNKEMKGDTLSIDNGNGSIKIVSAVTGTDRTNYFTKTLSTDLKTLTLKPKENIYEIFEESKTTDLKIVLDETIIKDKENNSLGGTTSFNHRIKNITTAKTKIQFSGTNCDIYVDTVKDNSSVHECNIGQVLNIKCAADSTHQFAGWLISGEGYTASSGTTPLKLYKENSGSSECFVSIENPGSSETKVTVYKSTGDANISVVPVIELTPAFTTSFNSTASVPCDSPIVLTFNKPMNSSTLTLYKENSSNAYKGSIQIVKNKSTVHCEQYFDSPVYNSSAKTLTITPKETIRNLLDEVASFEFNVILDGNYISDSYGYKSNKQEEFTYTVNTNTIAKTKVKFDFNGAIVKVDGQTINSGDVYEYNYGQTYTIECAPSETFKFENWSITSYDSNYIIFDDVTSNTSVATKTAKLKTIRPSTTAVTVKCNNNEILKFEGGTNNYKISGVNKYKKTEVEFNRTINYSEKIYIATSLDDTVGITSDFDVSSETVSGKFILSVKPNSSFYTKLASGNMIDVYVLLDTTATDSTGVPLSSFYNETNDSSYTLAKINNKNYLQIGRARYNNDLETGNPVIEINSITGYDSTKQLSDIPYNATPLQVSYNYSGTDFVDWIVTKQRYSGSINYDFDSELSAIIRNHCNNSITFKVKGTDAESGLDSLYIKETLLRSYDDNEIYSEPVVSAPYCFGNSNIITDTYTFVSDKDGLLKLELYILDKDGNPSEVKTYYVVRDTSLNFTTSVGVKATYPEIKSTSSGTTFNTISEVFIDSINQYSVKFKFGNPGVYTASKGYTTFGDIWLGQDRYSYGVSKNKDFKLGYAYNTNKNNLPEDINSNLVTTVDIGSEFDITVTDFTKNTYVRFFAQDEVGNVSYEDMVIPFAGRMMYSEDTVVSNQTEIRSYPELQTDIMNDYNVITNIQYYICNENGTNGSNYYYGAPYSTGEETVYQFPGINGLTGQHFKIDQLINYENPKIYCQYRYEFQNIHEADKDGTTNYLKIQGPLGTPINLAPELSTALNEPGFTIDSIINGELNSGNAKCTISLTDKQSDFTYFAIDWNNNSYPFNGLDKISFESKMPNYNATASLYVNVIAVDTDGKRKEGSEIQIHGSGVTSYFAELDTTPPEVKTIGSKLFSFDGEYFYFMKYDEKSSLKTFGQNDLRQYVKGYYYYTNSSISEPEKVMKPNLNIYPSRKLSVIKNEYDVINSANFLSEDYGKLLVPLVDIEDNENVYLYLVFEDKFGNTTEGIYFNGKNSSVLNSKPELNYHEDNENGEYSLTITCSQDTSSEHSEKTDYSATVSYYDPVEKTWKGAAATDYAVGIDGTVKNTTTSTQLINYQLELNDLDSFTGLICQNKDLTGKFIKVTIKALTPNGWTGAYSYPTYFYTGNVTCNLKNLVEGKNGYSVLSDQPVYVHALASFKDRGTNLDEWERHAEKIPGAYGTSPGVTYNPIDYIQDGDYYVVVAYFADNTYLMSDVKRK